MTVVISWCVYFKSNRLFAVSLNSWFHEDNDWQFHNATGKTFSIATRKNVVPIKNNVILTRCSWIKRLIIVVLKRLFLRHAFTDWDTQKSYSIGIVAFMVSVQNSWISKIEISRSKNKPTCLKCNFAVEWHQTESKSS